MSKDIPIRERRYLVKGREVMVLVPPTFKRGTIRNCLIRYLDTGEKVVRPFRGLRRIKEGS